MNERIALYPTEAFFMAKSKTHKFLKRMQKYKTDIAAFAEDVLGQKVSWQQKQLYDLVLKKQSISVVYGDGTLGDTYKIIALWSAIHKKQSIIVIAETPILHFLSLWIDHLCIKDKENLKQIIETVETYQINPRFGIHNRTFSNDSLVLVFQSEKIRNLDLLLSNISTSNVIMFGKARAKSECSQIFYDSHHDLSIKNGGTWCNLVFNSEQSPLVSKDFIVNAIKTYCCRDAKGYRMNILAQFPPEESMNSTPTWYMV